MFLVFSIVKYGRNFILVLLNHISKKKVEKSHPQKKKDFRGGSKWLNFCWLNFKGCQLWAPLSLTFHHQFWKFLYLSCCKFPEFFKTPHTFFIGMGLKGVRDKNQQKSKIRKYAILSQPRNVTSFEDENFQLFSYLYGSKVPKWNFAHIILWN